MVDYIIVCEMKLGYEDDFFYEAWAEAGENTVFSSPINPKTLRKATRCSSSTAEKASYEAEEKLKRFLAVFMEHHSSQWRARPIIFEAEERKSWDQ